MRKTKTETLAAALDVLARDIESQDGVANAAIAEAAERLRELDGEIKRLTRALKTADSPVDELIQKLENRGLGWSLDKNGRLIEARVWDWPTVIGRYRPQSIEPLAKMLSEAMRQVDWTRYPAKSHKNNDEKQPKH